MIYILYLKNDLNNYFLSEDTSTYHSLGYTYSDNFRNKLYYHLLEYNLPRISFLHKKEDPFQEISCIDFDTQKDVLIVWGIHELGVLKHLNFILPKNLVKYYWLWNTLPKNYSYCRNRLDKVLRMNYVIVTFDNNDSISYKINLRKQVFKYKIAKQNIEQMYDFYFLGLEKNRKNILYKIKKYLSKYKCKFIIPQNSSDYISYNQNLYFVQASKCIIDINRPEQNGLTLRPLEALFYNKKLITTYSGIKDYDFYRPQNIFVINENTYGDIDSFMELPIVEISSTIKNKYNFEFWIKSFK